MTTLPVDVLLLILDCVYLDLSPAERQRSLAAVARSSRSLNALATPLLYATPHLPTTRSAQKYGRLFSYNSSPWGVMGGRAKTINPSELVISQNERMVACPCDDFCHLCRGRCLDCSTIHSPLPNLLFVAMGLCDNLTSIIITDCYFDPEPLAHLLEEGTPLRQRIERLELVNACGSDEAIAWILWMYRNNKEVTTLLENRWEDDFRKDTETCEWLSAAHGVDLFNTDGSSAPGAEDNVVKKMRDNFDIFERFYWHSEDIISNAGRLESTFSSALAFPNLRRLSIPAFQETKLIPTLFGGRTFPNLKYLAFNHNPQLGRCELLVSDLDVLMMRRSVTRPYLYTITPGRNGTILPPTRSVPDAVDPVEWVALSYEDLKKFEVESPEYRGPELDELDLARIVVVLVEE
ncbi:hypothetical protein RQP46_002446 [Phenoliferia psychrophenolica]